MEDFFEGSNKLGGFYYSEAVLSNDPPNNMKKRVRDYDPMLDVRFCPELGTWGLFRRLSVHELRKNKFPVFGNGVEPEYVYCGKLKTYMLCQFMINKLHQHDPHRIRNVKQHLKDKRYGKQLNRQRVRLTMRDEIRHQTKDNKRYLKKNFQPLLDNNNEFLNKNIKNEKQGMGNRPLR